MEVDGLATDQVIPPKIQTLLTRKQTADALSPEIRQKYAKEYQLLISQIANYGLNHSLPAWDTEVNMEILSQILQEIDRKHGQDGVERICLAMVPEIDLSFRERDQVRIERWIGVAKKQLESV